MLFNLAGGGTEDGDIDFPKLSNIGDNRILSQFGRFLAERTAHDTRYFEIIGGLKSLNHKVAYVSVANNGCSDLAHCYFFSFETMS